MKLTPKEFELVYAALYNASEYEESYAQAWEGADKDVSEKALKQKQKFLNLRNKMQKWKAAQPSGEKEKP